MSTSSHAVTIVQPEQIRRTRASLTPKQRAFVAHYCSASVAMNGTEAARRAGYRGKDATLRAVASENLTKTNVRDEIDKRIAIALSSTKITIEKVLRDLEDTRLRALDNNRFSCAVRCSELQGKYLKMFSEKLEDTGPTLDELSLEDLVKLLNDIADSAHFDLRSMLAEHS